MGRRLSLTDGSISENAASTSVVDIFFPSFLAKNLTSKRSSVPEPSLSISRNNWRNFSTSISRIFSRAFVEECRPPSPSGVLFFGG